MNVNNERCTLPTKEHLFIVHKHIQRRYLFLRLTFIDLRPVAPTIVNFK